VVYNSTCRTQATEVPSILYRKPPPPAELTWNVFFRMIEECHEVSGSKTKMGSGECMCLTTET